jgi:amino acid transporter
MIPLNFARAMATSFALGKLISSMAGSNLFARGLSRKMSNMDDCPIQALSTVTCVSLVLTYAYQWYQGGGQTSLVGTGLNLVLLMGLITYCIQLYGFMILRLKLSKIHSEFRSPVGLWGAAYSFLLFLVGMVSALFLPPRQCSIILVIAGTFITVITLYYFMYAKHVQTFSDAEKEVMLLAHAEIKNANGKLRLRTLLLSARIQLLNFSCV